MFRRIWNLLSITALLLSLLPIAWAPQFAAAAELPSATALASDDISPPREPGPDAEAIADPTMFRRGEVIGEIAGATEPARYLVRLVDAPLASYQGGIPGLAATSPQVTGEDRLDPETPTSVAYLSYLEIQQANALTAVEQTLGRSVDVAFQYLAVLNGFAVTLTPQEAARVASLPQVLAVYRDVERELDTEIGPAHIGAPDIWNGNTSSSVATRGEGIVIGVIDSGINTQHPSFAATDGDGYVHINPYGPGVYQGWCATNPGFCNDKLIAAYTFHPNGGSPEDTDGHGSHTASTAGGNAHIATFNVGLSTYNLRIQGVAPRANIVAYKVCDPACPTSSSVAAINSAILNDQVDVLNYSISGSDNPWNDAVDLAFLDAYNAGIFIAASAGNAGPGPSTVAKTGPWNAAVTASTINRIIAHTLDVTGPTAPPELQGLAAVPGEGTAIAGNINNQIRYNATNPLGCTAFPAGFFADGLALIQRGGCTFSTKVGTAVAAGATGVVIFNNVGGPPISMGSLTGTPPAFMLALPDGLALRDYIIANPGATVRINVATSYLVDNTWEDIVGAFSSRGPSQFELLKPDFIAPGVNILAAMAQKPGNPAQYGFQQGTSMSSPHAAGAGALLKALNPTWSPAEIKSALASTAVGGLVKEDGVTPADPFDVGSGLLNLALAGSTGLVFDETYANYAAANPDTGGDPKTLNQPSLVDYDCVGTCTWERTVKSVLPFTATYTATVSAPAGLNITVAPLTFTIAPGESQILVVQADVLTAPVETFAFGNVTLETDAQHPTFAVEPTAVLLNEAFTDTTFPPTDWAVYKLQGGGTATWIRDTAQSRSAPASARRIYGGSADGNQDDWLVMPPLEVGLSFLRYFDRGQWLGDYGYSGVWISTESCNPADNNFVELLETPDIPNVTWRSSPVVVDLTAYAGETACLAFRYSGTFAHTWWIDDVFVETMGLLDVADIHMPVVVRPVAAQVQDLVSIETMVRSGSEDVTGYLVGDAVTALTVEVGGLVAADLSTDALLQDPTNGDPYNNDGGTFFTTVDVPSGAVRLLAEIIASDAPDMNLYIGTGATPSLATQVCVSPTIGWNEFCAVDNPAAGTWWVLVQNWQGSASQPDDVTLAAAVLDASDAGNMTIDGPAAVAAGTPFSVTVNWNEPSLVVGEKWYGFFTLGTDAGNPGNIGVTWVDLRYLGAPVAVANPTLLSAQPVDRVVTATLNLANAGDVPLLWEVVEQTPVHAPAVAVTRNAPLPALTALSGLTAESVAASAAVSFPSAPQSEVLWEQVVNGANGIVSDYSTTQNAGAYSANDFVLTEGASIEVIFAAGFDSSNTLISQPAISWAIYADAGGVPAGHPEDGTSMASAEWSYSAPPNGVGVDITGNNIRLDLAAAGEFVYLPDGAYWLTVYPTYNNNVTADPRWFWYQAAQVGAQTHLVSPLLFGGVLNWTSLSALGVTFTDTAFRIEGTPGPVCLPGDIPWLSLPITNGVTAPGSASPVDVVFDSTGLALGTYTGELCVATNDPQNAVVTISVTLEVAEVHTLDVSTAGQGTVDVDPDQLDYLYNDVVMLTAIADPGWGFDSWSGAASGTDEVITITITGDTVVTATFVALSPDLVIAKSVTPETDLSPGDTLTYTITLTNNGDAVATGVVLTDHLPSLVTFGAFVENTGAATEDGGVITWSGNLPAAETLTIIFTATVAENSTFVTAPVINQVVFTSEDAGNGMAQASFTIKPPRTIFLPLVMRNF